jgi:hypothetical protein
MAQGIMNGDLLDTISETLQTAQVTSNLQATSIIAAARLITGESPMVTAYPTYTEISFTPSQQIKLRDALEKMLSGSPGPVRVNAGSVVYPVVLKRLIPLLVIAFALGFIIKR